MGKIRIWFDEEADYLEIGTSRRKGYLKDVGNDIWERIDDNGKITGFAILNFKKRLDHMKKEVELPLEVAFHG